MVYDSKFGNTERLARAIAEVLGTDTPAALVAASAASVSDLAGVDLLVVGGPTQGHGVSPALRAFLDRIPPEAVGDMPTLTFDTRLGWPRFLSGSAAAQIAKRLTRKGARLLVPAESFLVTSGEGPLAEGELARASAWADHARALAGLPGREPVSAGCS
ncbi:MAG TPA: flavodoxin family protein [Gammaproteobacteria bacterium]|nr:flavodoxin family protein [Gammaproteobacteria bacterium]